ncbi:MAG: hypothetical protein NVSMB12_12360 [Acidimicrobiales bacterium]
MSRQDVENGEKRWLEACNRGDAKGVAAVYAEGARLMPPNADVVEGRAAIEGFMAPFAETGVQMTFELVDVHETPHLCVSIGRYEMVFPAVDGGEAQRDSGKFMEVWTRQSDGDWLIVDDIFNSSLPAPAP